MKADVDFFTGPAPKGIHSEVSEMLVAEKEHFGSSRKARWLDL
jgi:sulfide:quinone oxidoreductase